MQPVPCVLGLLMRSAQNQVSAPFSYSRSSAQSGRCPPLTSTAVPKRAWSACAARSMPARLWIDRPLRASASGILGVTTRAQRHQPLGKAALRVRRKQPGTAGGDHDRVEHDVFHPVQAQPVRNGVNYARVRHHADFHGVGPDIGKHAVELLCHKTGGRS